MVERMLGQTKGRLSHRRELGGDFERVYTYLRAALEADAPPAEVQRGLEEMVGRAQLGRCFLVEQLVFMELTRG